MIRRTLLLIALLCGVGGVARAQALAPDIAVAADGTGQFTSVHAAVQSIPKGNGERTIILIKDGVYNEKVRIDAACITLRGQSRDKTRIEFAQLNDDFTKKPDDRGRAVVNINGDDCVVENLTIKNTAGVVGPHSFAIYGKADRTVIIDCDVLSEGADTVSLWKGDTGRYYHARCTFRGAVDFVCPRGWCYIADSSFFETKNTAAIWHDGSKNEDQKFVLRNCKFDGVEGWNLARHHHDAAFYLLDCTFSKTMIDRPPFRVRYPLDPAAATQGDIARNKDLDKTNQWGERAYFFNCHRNGGDDYPWHADNLHSPKSQEITPKWTFGGTWDPEDKVGPRIFEIVHQQGEIMVGFYESVTVKGKPIGYISGSGTKTLRFSQPPTDMRGGAIIASDASATIRHAVLPQ